MATMETKTSGGIGDSVLRKEDRKFVTGEGRYTDDLKLPGMLHAVFVRSPFGHAKLNLIDASAALAMPGVHAVLTHETLPVETGVLSASNPPGSDVRQPEQPILVKEYARYVGEPVAMVIAEDRYIARDAADSVLVDRPVRLTGFEEVVNAGGSLDEAAAKAGDGTSPLDDLDGSAEYKRHLAGVLARQAYEAAQG